jgi:hypothetical protein
MNNYDKFHQAIDTLIEINKSNKTEFNKSLNFDRVSDELYKKEFCTVKVDIGRRSGKTEYIKRNAKANDLIIAPKLITGRFLYEGLNYVSANTLKFESLLVEKALYNNIYIDEPSLHKNIDQYYRLGCRDSTFIFLGN